MHDEQEARGKGLSRKQFLAAGAVAGAAVGVGAELGFAGSV
jgi:hypothetical protein